MQIDYVTFRDIGNAGDNLIGYALQELFNLISRDSIDYNVVHLARDNYGEKCNSGNILFGPGGILTGSPNASAPDTLFLRSINDELLEKWSSNRPVIYAFGSGTNSSSLYRPFTKASGKLLGRLISLSNKFFLRGTSDIQRLSNYLINTSDKSKLVFQPCPSIFLDRIYGIPPRSSDRVAINYDFANIKKDELADHPLLKFVLYVRSCGLTPVLFGNHPVDVSESVLDFFNGECVFNSPKYQAEDIKKALKKNSVSPFVNRMHQARDLAADYCGYRFAFGKRLHGFLPFFSFDGISIFLTNRSVRKSIPNDYFAMPSLLLESADGSQRLDFELLRKKLDWLVLHEKTIKRQVNDNREKLWELTKANAKEVIEAYSSAAKFC
jgi:hypothetical protein